MRVSLNIKPPLRNWAEHDLDRGCPPEQLIESLIAQRYDPPPAVTVGA